MTIQDLIENLRKLPQEYEVQIDGDGNEPIDIGCFVLVQDENKILLGKKLTYRRGICLGRLRSR